MVKKLSVLGLVLFMVCGLYGCIAAVAIIAGTSEAKEKVNISYSQAIDAVKATFRSEDLKLRWAYIKPSIAAAKAKYMGDKTIRILVTKVSDSETEIAVRCGMTDAGKDDARKLLDQIIKAADLFTPREVGDTDTETSGAEKAAEGTE
jgi:HJR/Mrr/RecB family endonuclease